MPAIGLLIGASAEASSANVAGFRQGLRQSGYVENQNVRTVLRWAEGQYDRLPEMASELVNLNVAVIVAFGPAPTKAVVAATKTIPTVFALSDDPVKLGIIASLSRPGGNATGLTFLGSELVGKQFEALHELLPKAGAVGLLLNPTSPAIEAHLRDVPVVTRTFGWRVVIQNASSSEHLDGAYAAFIQQQVSGLVVPSDPFFYGRRTQLVTLASRHALPSIYPDREYVADGGLMSYGANLTEAYRQAGIFAGRVLKGDKPMDLPVQQATKVELIVNLKTAKALGAEFPLSLLMRINESIE